MGAGRILAAGAVLTRTFGKGEKARKVFTQTLNGKTLTKVFDNKGNLLIERVKMFERNSVGNKNVITRTQASVEKPIATGPITLGIKSVYDRVYTTSGEFLGARQVIYRAQGVGANPLSGINPKNRLVIKSANDGGPTVATRIYNGTRREAMVCDVAAGNRTGFLSNWKTVYFDSKTGLLPPQDWEPMLNNPRLKTNMVSFWGLEKFV